MILSGELISQTSREAGFPISRTYLPTEYFGSGQNWAIAQDEKGIMYFGNNLGVLEYDGVSWRLTPLPSIVRSIAVNINQQVCIGAQGDFGYLRPDSSGRQSFVSLAQQLAPEDRNFTNVWKIYATSEGTYFHTLSHLFRWSPEGIKIWRPETSFGWAFLADNQLYVLEEGKGLMQMVDDSLRLVPGTSVYAEERVYFVLPFQKDQLLIGTRTRGLELLKDGHVQPFATEGEEYLKNSSIYHATVLPNGNIAITTIQGGLVILSAEGKLVNIFDDKVLPDKKVHYVFSRAPGETWLALDDGIAYLNFPAPLTFFGESSKMPGDVEAICRYQSRLYVATSSNGLHVLQPLQMSEGKITLPEFHQVAGIDPVENCRSVLSVGGHLLIGTSQNIYGISGAEEAPVLITPHSGFFMIRSRLDTNRVYVGGNGECYSLRFEAGVWRYEGAIEGINVEEIRPIMETEEGDLWLGTRNHGTIRIKMGRNFRTDPPIERFYTDQGLPEGDVYPYPVDGGVKFATDKGLYTFNENRRAFLPDSSLGKAVTGGGMEVFRMSEDEQGNVWLVTPAYVGINRAQSDKTYLLDTLPFIQIPRNNITAIFPEPPGIVWLGGNDGVYRFDPFMEGNYRFDFSALIRQVKVNGDSLLFGGYFGNDEGTSGRFQQTTGQQPDLDYKNNELRFEFAATSFSNTAANRFQYLLEGFDEQWSNWTGETQKNYTNLPPGDYNFRVRAKDLYGNLSSEAAFSMSIIPPWYRTWWAYLLFALLGTGFLAGIVLAYVRYHTREQTAKLAKEQLLNRRLKELDQLKDQFLANTSHELRTPLHGIVGIAESIFDDLEVKTQEELRQNMGMIIASGRRLSSLVNDLLDFSRAKTHDLHLQLKSLDLSSMVNVVLQACRPLSGNADLELKNEIPLGLPPVLADENRLQQILFNLVGNAIKFTHKGYVRIRAYSEEDRIIVVVQDTGIGVSKEKQSSIFNYFEQADGSVTRTYEGTGLGLAITRQLVELHEGSIWVESTPNKGASFYFTLPISKEPTQLPKMQVQKKIAQTPLLARDFKLGIPLAGSADDRVKILIVDDEIINHQVLRNYLAGEQYLITSVMSGKEAIEAIQLGVKFDLVLLDVMMPEISGYEVCQAIREQHLPSEMPVIMVTAKNQVQDLVQGLATGANDYLAKPFKKEEFLARVKTQLDLHLINEVTSKFVPNEFLRSLGHKRITEARLGDQTERNVTVLFLDIRDYTSLAESLTPEENFRFVNAFHGRMGPVIRQYHGFINQYLGDAIMAIFPDSPTDALKAAIQMEKTLEKYNGERQAKNRKTVRMGMGLHTGPLIMGIIGDEKRLDAATVADTVNVASRIQELTKFYGAPLLLSEQSLMRIEGKENFHFRYLGSVLVKGKKTPLKIFECFDVEPPGVRKKKQDTLPDFEKGLAHFFAKDFPEASVAFNHVLKANPADRAAELLLNKSSRYTYEGVPDNWTGVETVVFK